MSDATAEVAKRARLTNDELRALNPDNVMEFFAGKGTKVTDLSAELGSGFDVLPTDKKGKLVDEQFVIIEWHFSKGDKGEFVSLAVMTAEGKKLIVNDGSSGIRDQIHDLENRGVEAPVLVKRGLRVSEYWYDEETGEKFKNESDGDNLKKAETYYLAV